MSIGVGGAHEVEKLLAIDGYNCCRDREGDKALIGYPWASRLSYTAVHFKHGSK